MFGWEFSDLKVSIITVCPLNHHDTKWTY
uniref:Uncharacterized protein n=1 Tax=Rhizophora mucronata TaxID=61149 RepID=A0A2P2QWY3_RHIMU